jgi:predicted nucleic acid-binding Zn ribbon protein
MDPLNQVERKKAFSNFLIFFLVTTALIIAAVILVYRFLSAKIIS